MIEESTQVVTGKQPFPKTHIGVVIYDIVTGERKGGSQATPGISPPTVAPLAWDDRPSDNFALNVLNNGAGAGKVGRRGLYATTNNQGRRILLPSRGSTTPSVRY